MNDKQFATACAKINKKLGLAQTYFDDGAAASATRCLIDAQEELAKLTKKTNEAAIDRAREMEKLRQG